MSYPSQRASIAMRRPLLPRIVGLFAGMLIAMPVAFANSAMPSAGTAIGNSATAIFHDSSGETHETTSNEVRTIVSSVYAVELDHGQNQTHQTAIASRAYFVHEAMNLGNDDDGFLINVENIGVNVDPASLQLFPDSNGDGMPDTGTIGIDLATTPYAVPGHTQRDRSYRFVIVASVKAGTPSGASGTDFTVKVTSAADSSKTSSVQDSMAVVSGAAFDVGPALASQTLSAGEKKTIVFNVHNRSTVDGPVVIRQVIGQNKSEGLSFVGNEFQILGEKVTDKAAVNLNGKPVSVSIEHNGDVTTLIAAFQMRHNQDGIIAFEVQASKDILPGASRELRMDYAKSTPNSADEPTTDHDAPFLSSLPARIEINNTAGVALSAGTEIAGTLYGMREQFPHTLTNQGSAVETFNLSVANSSFPAGTEFEFYTADGRSHLTDTNGDGIVDTGPLEPSRAYAFVLRTSLQAKSAPPTSNAKITVIARAPTGAAQAQAVDSIKQILAATVVVSHQNPYSGGEAAKEFEHSVDPTQPLMLTLYVTNTSQVDKEDRYTLVAVADDTSIRATFHAPVGGKCDAEHVGSALSLSDPIHPGMDNATQVCALVSPLDHQTQASIDFRAESARTAANFKLSGNLHGGTHSFVIVSSHSGTVSPGETVVYSHELVNTGSAPIPADALTARIGESAHGWSSHLYLDPTRSGSLDKATLLPADGKIPLALDTSGARIALLLAVTAPANAPQDQHDVTTLTISGDGALGTISASDTTVISSSLLTIIKEQAVDPSCVTQPPTSGAFGKTNVMAKPGECIWYRVTAVNPGPADVTEVEIDDRVPAYTALAATPATGPDSVSATVTVAGDTVRLTTPELEAGANASLIYSVKIDK